MPAPACSYHVVAPTTCLLINILAEIIIDMAASLPTYLKPGGVCIASGILADKSAAVQEAMRAAGLTIVQELEQEGWVALVAVRPA